MHQGEIVEQGGHDELIANEGIYKKLVNMQSFE
jgi:subfamily B ATP-binding cassette protein MsbA